MALSGSVILLHCIFSFFVHITQMHLLFEKKISLISKRENSLITFGGVHSVDTFFEQTRRLTISSHHGFVQSQQATYHNNRGFCMSGSQRQQQLGNLFWSLYSTLTQLYQLFNVWELLTFKPEHEDVNLGETVAFSCRWMRPQIFRYETPSMITSFHAMWTGLNVRDSPPSDFWWSATENKFKISC